MNTVRVLGLLIALSVAVNVGFVAGITARFTGVGVAQAILAGAGATGTALVIYFAAVSAYHVT